MWDLPYIQREAIHGQAPGLALYPAMILDCWTVERPQEEPNMNNCNERSSLAYFSI